ncbi:MAG: Rubrerythrin [Burkholderiales bacterium]|jgi:rubrerythrin|nr:Rubrerythrin [Burkholderiales bacterium]
MIESATELYVHAIAIEREAAQRYTEFAEHMADRGEPTLARLFRLLAEGETKHLDALMRRTDGVALPELGSDYSWLDQGAPETAARELVFRLMTQRDALEIALRAEKRARAFFEHAARVADDPAVRALAREMAAEEAEHVALIERMLSRTPGRDVDWESIFA